MLKTYNDFDEANISQIQPKGWLEEFLQYQATGLTGHLECAGYPFDVLAWDDYKRFVPGAVDKPGWIPGGMDNPGWVPYEQTAYWIDGMERCGQLLDAGELLCKAEKNYDYVFENAAEDGYLGPEFLREEGAMNRWPHVVFFRALMARYSATHDQNILDKISDYYLKNDSDYTIGRNVLHVEIMAWAYLHTGDERLLQLAEKTYRICNELEKTKSCIHESFMSSDEIPYAHGVSFNEYCKMGAILYSCTGREEYLKPVIHAYKKVDKYHMLIDGCPCGNEFMVSNHYMQGHETCIVTDYTWTIGYLLMATGDGKYADKIERCIFNAGIGSVLEDFKGLQYISSANQLVLDAHSSHHMYYRGDSRISYRPSPGTQCCTGNVTRFFPNYCARMWMQKGDSVWATLYGASEYTFEKDGRRIVVEEDTVYPFEDGIRFRFHMEQETEFEFCVRVPSWCKTYKLLLNGQEINLKPEKGFVHLRRVFSPNDCIQATFESEPKLISDGRSRCYVERGPLVYAFGMKGNRLVDTEDERSTEDFPAYNIYPDKEWNYALCVGKEDLKEMQVSYHGIKGNPWDVEFAPITIKVKARKVKGWEMKHRNRIYQVHNFTRPLKWNIVSGDFTLTPEVPKAKMMTEKNLGKKETIELVPYGAAKLRLSVFPKCDVY